MKHILIRCDASTTIGTGHVYRCRSIARDLKDSGATVTFICRAQHGDLNDLLQQEFQVLRLPSQSVRSLQGLEGREIYGAALGCSQHTDATQTIKAVRQANITHVQYLIVDHYSLDISWEQEVLVALSENSKPPKLMVIDDLADRVHMADILLDQNFFGDLGSQRYQSFVPSSCLQLLGPSYALLSKEYSQLHPIVPARNELRRVLVFFGGIDSYDLTTKVIKALKTPPFDGLAVDVVLSKNSPNFHSVQELVSSRAYTSLHSNLPTLSALMARADLSIGASGSTTWERACLGLPSLVIVCAPNQHAFAKALEEDSYITVLSESPYVSVEEIRSQLLAYEFDRHQGEICRQLTDGRGSSRVSSILMSSR